MPVPAALLPLLCANGVGVSVGNSCACIFGADVVKGESFLSVFFKRSKMTDERERKPVYNYSLWATRKPGDEIIVPP